MTVTGEEVRVSTPASVQVAGVVTAQSLQTWMQVTVDGAQAAWLRIPFRIEKAPLTVTANDNTITYGDAPAGGGFTCSGFVNGETEAALGGTIAYTFSYKQYGDAGDKYTITPSGLPPSPAPGR